MECCAVARTGQTDVELRELHESLLCQLRSQHELLQELSDNSKQVSGELATIRHFLANTSKHWLSAKTKTLDVRGVGTHGIGEAAKFSHKPRGCNSLLDHTQVYVIVPGFTDGC